MNTRPVVHVEWPLGTSFGQIMNELRVWLDDSKIEPAETKPLPTTKGVGFEVRFLSDADALLFADHFKAQVVPSPTV